MRQARILWLLALCWPALAGAAQVQSFSPQGSVRDVRQATARFSESMVRFGDPRLPDPFDIACAASGHGRWADERNWVYDFDADLAAGQSCRFTLKAGLKSLAGAALSGKKEFSFATGGPAVRAALPGEGSQTVDAEQVFLLATDAPATRASIEASGYCAVANLAERLPLQLIEGKEREAVLAQRRALSYSYYRVLFKNGDTDYLQINSDELARRERDIAVVRCSRPLPEDTEFDLVWGKGIATSSGAATTIDQVLKYRTRPAFSASFGCDRVNADAACTPVLAMSLRFSAPVPTQLAMQIRLKGAGGTREPEPADEDAPFVDRIEFQPPFPESAALELQLPAGFKDDAGRQLANAGSFPLKIATDSAPPLAKFSGEFGILEASEGGVLPVTLRDVESPVAASRIGGASKRIDDEAQILQWIARVKTNMSGRWDQDVYVQPGVESVFAGSSAEAFELPRPADAKAFEVIGIPLKERGFHVVEIASPRLGAALLGKPATRYVATTALVTNMAVHFKWGREGSLAFVTTLDGGRPVAGAALKIVDGCNGSAVWSGSTGKDGIARIDSLPKPETWVNCDSEDGHPLMISARHDGDFSFVMSSWNDGIAPSDFNLNVGLWDTPTIAHTVFDRSLFRAGETVAMKHYWRERGKDGIKVPALRPDKLVIEHSGSDQKVELALSFDERGIAESQWPIPQAAKLGEYRLRFEGKDGLSADAGSFRVEQYRIPLMRALVQPPQAPAIATTQLPLDLYVGYFSGGGAAGLPVKLRTQLQPRTISFKNYDNFTFDARPIKTGVSEENQGGLFPDDDGDAQADADAKPKPSRTLPLNLDANGSAHSLIDELPLSDRAQTLVAELEYPDANGEVSSVRSSVPLWPAAQVVGIATQGWGAAKDQLQFQTVVLDLKGQPLKDRTVDVALYQLKTHSYRKRLVGGFYAYSHSSETIKLAEKCSGRTDANGLLFCKLDPGVSGEILIEASARDDDGRVARAVTSTWIAGAEQWWFAQGDSDRMDLIADKREVEPGEKLKLQVRMPFRKATALVTIEREGVIDAFVTELSGREPVIEVPMLDRYAPNVFVSVLALRPRVGDFRSTFYSFLRWLGLDRWLQLDGGSATAMVDLSKPAYRLGMTAVDVGWSAHRLEVSVKPQQQTYKTRGLAKVDVQVKAAGSGQLPAAAEIAFSAVDEALLDLLPNDSVHLLEAMMQRRGIEVFTSTAQMQVVGKRHFGRKALAPGGGGGRGAPREMLDSLLLWKGRVPLDAQGRATVEVPLNDALTAFRLTAVASAGADRFGEGHASIRTTQDIQILSGLPPLLRENDRFDAIFTVRNTTTQAQQVIVDAETLIPGQDAPVRQTQQLTIPGNTAAPARFAFTVPFGIDRLSWTVTAESADGKQTLDALKVAQQVVPAYPVRVYQATLLQLDAHQELPIAKPADAIADRNGLTRGGIRVALSPSLTTSLDGVRDWMNVYPYACIEQRASKAIALGDHPMWDLQMSGLSAYLDRDGLVKYFPSSWLEGSDSLTAYLLQIASEAGWEIPQAEREQMLDGLEHFAEGKLQRGLRVDNASVTERKLAAIEALSRYERAKPEWLGTITIDPNLWHTSALIDWIGILQRVEGLPKREQRLIEAKTLLRSRLNFQGTTMSFSAEQDDALWWLMISADVNAVRAVLALLPEADWREDMPRLVRGAVGRQQRGHWNLTTANAWGTLALAGFARAFEKETVSGSTSARLGDDTQQHAWKDTQAAALDLRWPTAAGTLSLDHSGSGAPWITVQSRAAIPLREPLSSGYRITRTVTPVEQKTKGKWSVGDVARVRLDIDAQSDMSWVVVDDPIPGGSTLLGGGLGRDSALLSQDDRKSGDAWPAFEERRFDFYRAYYAFVPKGRFSTEYTLRYNNAGRFEMPATHVEAMYAPEMLGESPNAAVEVVAP
ncbi:alpha-2-macroglobulin family protein [Hydrocarboniphaga sp.]|uniref:alpha-2-macroglobulin family protein n=1 Tax=Hydrocarboniphaga sp. TaxID=2033016 RepID=UPI003D13F1DD